MEQQVIDVKDVVFSYENGHEILKGVSFQADRKEALGIIGANGVGKSTLLRILVGLETDYKGSVMVDKIPVTKKNLPQVRMKAGYLFQDSDNQLFNQTVYDDVAFALRNYGLKEDEVEAGVSEALQIIGISHLRDKQIYKMSGGEKKLAAIATILAMKPDILLLDEPTIALDPRNRRNLIHILNRLDYVKIIASHDLDMILDTCGRVLLMADGRIVCEGPAEEILQEKELLEANGLELPLSGIAQPRL